MRIPGWRWIRRGMLATLALIVALTLHYSLPGVDIVRIVGTENRRIEFGSNSWFWAAPDAGTADGTSRDVFFIQTVRPSGAPMVYRNEDTGWRWPPYFKLNSHNVQTVASSLISSPEAPKWVAVTHYGWRSELFTIFPNALSLREVAGPDETVRPWGAYAVLGILAVALLALWRFAVILHRAYVAPTLGRMAEVLRRWR
jgi:hypothetical protein